MSRKQRLHEIEREHRHALATRSTPTDSWLNGYQEDVGFLLARMREYDRLGRMLRDLAVLARDDNPGLADAVLALSETERQAQLEPA